MKNKKSLMLVILLMLALLTCYAVTGTYAKYTSSISGKDEARVAKWAWSVNNSNVDLGTAEFAMDLFNNSTLLDSNCKSAEDDVSTTTSDTVIAPGTCGKFEVVLKNNSEVNASYSYALSQVNTNSIPLVFSTDGNTFVDINAFSITGEVNAGATAATKTIYWKWAYDNSTNTAATDTADTTLGIAGTAKVEITATVTLTQKD